AARWAKTLTDAARISPLHEAVIACALQRALQGDAQQAPRDLQNLLALLKELLIAMGQRIEFSETKAYLTAIKASGKTGQLARDLLALEARPDPERSRQAALRALAGHIQRAQRWTAR